MTQNMTHNWKVVVAASMKFNFQWPMLPFVLTTSQIDVVNRIMECTLQCTLFISKEKLDMNSTRKLQDVLDIINQNWLCPWSLFCCRGSLSPLKSTRWQWPWLKMHQIKKQMPLWKTKFLRYMYNFVAWPKKIHPLQRS